jgi:hypothetical protein
MKSGQGGGGLRAMRCKQWQSSGVGWHSFRILHSNIQTFKHSNIQTFKQHAIAASSHFLMMLNGNYFKMNNWQQHGKSGAIKRCR